MQYGPVDGTLNWESRDLDFIAISSLDLYITPVICASLSLPACLFRMHTLWAETASTISSVYIYAVSSSIVSQF